MIRVWLIGRREFTSFSDGATFWVALLFGPAIAALSALAGLSQPVKLAGVAVVAARLLDPVATVRLVMALLLWLTLVTALGMLLQAIVRERSSRCLETLLASVRPMEIILGKMFGVAAVTGVVMISWLLSTAIGGMFSLGGGLGSAAAPFLKVMADPGLILQAALLFVTGFAFYGALIAVVGVLARDEPGAQNLARPLFGVLLMIFFAALATTGMHMTPPAWLVWVPPLTPFMLLLKPGLLSPPGWAAVLAETFAAAGLLLWIGGRFLSGEGLQRRAVPAPGAEEAA